MKDNVNKNATVKTAKQKESASNITLISLFAGAGGMGIGFEKAGFKTIWANEYDKTIAPSYQNYFPESKFDGRSILDIPDEDIPLGAIGIIGGPPCQSWSEAGARCGLDDLRGQLFHEYIRVIRHVQPKFCVAENVHGIIHSRNIESFMNIIDMFKKEDYKVSWKLLKASDYGAAQDLTITRSCCLPIAKPAILGKYEVESVNKFNLSFLSMVAFQ
jgi:DNA (cytosine-5)-methyltransferase 1